MFTRGLYVFKRDIELGNAHAQALFDRIPAKKRADVPRAFSDHAVHEDEVGLPPPTVKLIRRVG